MSLDKIYIEFMLRGLETDYDLITKIEVATINPHLTVSLYTLGYIINHIANQPVDQRTEREIFGLFVLDSYGFQIQGIKIFFITKIIQLVLISKNSTHWTNTIQVRNALETAVEGFTIRVFKEVFELA